MNARILFVAVLTWLSAVSVQAGEPLTVSERDRLSKVRVQTHAAFETYALPTAGSIGLIGFKRDEFFARYFHWGPAVYGAVLGDRGGYGIAALGVGGTLPVLPRVEWDTRLLLGSGGGNGMKTGGGLVLHGVTGVLLELTSGLRVALHGGYLDFPTGEFRAPVASAALVFTGTKVVLPE